MSQVGVVIALYNGEKYICEQLDSILNQSKTPDKVWLADDGSTDHTYEIVEDWIKTHDLEKSWKLMRNQQNCGPSKNFIEMLKNTDTEYIFLSDQDDVWMPDKVQRMVEQLESNREINVLYADVINDRNLERAQKQADEYSFGSGTVKAVEFSASNYFFKGLGCATCMRGTFVKSVLPYWTDGWEHDMFLWACAQITNTGYHYERAVIWRRIHENNVSMTGTKSREKRMIQVRSSLQRPLQLMKMMEDFRIDDLQKRTFLNHYYNSLQLRYNALYHRNIITGLYILLTKRKYYLKGGKGAALDLLLILMGDRSIRL